jgi:hypothetical protein
MEIFITTTVRTSDRTKIQLLWVLDHRGPEGNKIASWLKRNGSEHPFIGSDLAHDISAGVAETLRNWMNRNHKKH